MKRAARLAAVALLSLLLASCTHAPAFNILGSYFPAWMLCALAGIVLAILLRLLFNRLHLEEYARPEIVTYPCAAALFTCTLWLLFFD